MIKAFSLSVTLFIATLVVAQSNLSVRYSDVFYKNYKYQKSNEEYESITYYRKALNYHLLENGKVLQNSSEVMGYRKKGASQSDFDALTSINLYDDTKFLSGKTVSRKTFTYEKYQSDHFQNAKNTADKYRLTNFFETEHYIFYAYSGWSSGYATVRDINLNYLIELSSKKHFNNEKFTIKDVKEGANKTLYLLLAFKTDGKLAVVRLKPDNSEENFKVDYKRFNFKPGNIMMTLHHISESSFYIQYNQNQGEGYLSRVNKFNSKDIDDANKTYVDPGTNMTILKNTTPTILHTTSSGDLIGYYRNAGKSIKLFRYNPLNEKLINSKEVENELTKKVAGGILNYDVCGDYSNGNLVIIPYKKGGEYENKKFQILVFNDNLEVKEKTDIKAIKNDRLKSFDRVKVNARHRKILFYDGPTYEKNNKFLMANF